jgi:hypothetical protein
MHGRRRRFVNDEKGWLVNDEKGWLEIEDDVDALHAHKIGLNDLEWVILI